MSCQAPRERPIKYGWCRYSSTGPSIHLFIHSQSISLTGMGRLPHARPVPALRCRASVLMELMRQPEPEDDDARMIIQSQGILVFQVAAIREASTVPGARRPQHPQCMYVWRKGHTLGAGLLLVSPLTCTIPPYSGCSWLLSSTPHEDPLRHREVGQSGPCSHG